MDPGFLVKTELPDSPDEQHLDYQGDSTWPDPSSNTQEDPLNQEEMILGDEENLLIVKHEVMEEDYQVEQKDAPQSLLTAVKRKPKGKRQREKTGLTYTCSVCEKKFLYESSLEIHMRFHSGENLRQCSECGKRYATQYALKRHSRTHKKAVANVCNICNASFMDPGDFNKHKLFHLTGQPPYTCKECGDAFETYSAIKAHRSRKHREKWQCRHCWETFPTEKLYQDHRVVHETYVCPQCHAKFMTQELLDMHLEESGEHQAPPNVLPADDLTTKIEIEEALYPLVDSEVEEEFTESQIEQVPILEKGVLKSSLFKDETDIPQEIKELESPLKIFKYFFNEDLIDHILEETNRFSLQEGEPFVLAKHDLYKYLGICIMTSVHGVDNQRDYWSAQVGNAIIKEAMPMRTFEKIKHTLHFNDNFKMPEGDDPQFDNLYKLRPVVTKLLDRFHSIPPEQMLSVSEHICSATWSRLGVKLYVISGLSGFVYNFEISMRSQSFSGNTVLRLLMPIPQHLNYRVFCENTSIELLTELHRCGYLAIGTIGKEIIEKKKLRDLDKQPRGSHCESVTENGDTKITSVSWKDTKIIHLASTFVGVDPLEICSRYDKRLEKKIPVKTPQIVKQYFKHKGAVELLDSLIGRCKINISSSKWYIRVFYHLLDLTALNSWILYKRVTEERGEVPMNLPKFKMILAECLCKVSAPVTILTSEEKNQQIEHKRTKKSAAYIPPSDLRLDRMDHFPIYGESRGRCRNLDCKRASYMKCQKCQVHLCLNQNRNCFWDFHN